MGLEPATLRLLSLRFNRLSHRSYARASLQDVVITSHCLILRHRTSDRQWFDPTQFPKSLSGQPGLYDKKMFFVYLGERNTPGNNLHDERVPIRQRSTVPMPERFNTTWLTSAVVVINMCRLTARDSMMHHVRSYVLSHKSTLINLKDTFLVFPGLRKLG